MKTKIVYCVTSGVNDIYLPQALISVFTLRKYTPKAYVILVIDDKTNNILTQNLKDSINRYFNEIVVVNIATTFNKKQRSRYLKTKLREIITGDFLFIDTDTVIVSDISPIDNCTYSIGATLDRHSFLNSHIHKEMIEKDISYVGLEIKDLQDRYFNSGVLYVKDNTATHNLYNHWFENWQQSCMKGKDIDQPALALANKQCNFMIEELNGSWNCQLSDNFLPYLEEAKILHYFASNGITPYQLYDKDLFSEIMKSGLIPQRIQLALEKPKSFFREHRIICNADLNFIKTNSYKLFKYHKTLFNFIETISYIIIFSLRKVNSLFGFRK